MATSLDFPLNPADGDQHTIGNKTYAYDAAVKAWSLFARSNYIVTAGTIQESHIADGAISTRAISDNSVTTAKIQEGAARQVLQTADDGATVIWGDLIVLEPEANGDPVAGDFTGNTTFVGQYK